MIIKEIQNRRSVRSFKENPVSEDQILEIIKAGQFAPSAKGNHKIEFIVVKNQETKNKICDVLGQEFVKEAQVLIVPVVGKNNSVLPVQDLSVASENMLLQVDALGLGSVWKNVREELRGEVGKILNLPEDHLLINMLPVGVPAEKPSPHTEIDFSKEKIHFEKW
ncbi:MAG: nitroreductase family protein [Candidatus Pacebacteria bacterium]|nr:nitroreductase family protein [Candidatus Paceibacterota bacterium]